MFEFNGHVGMTKPQYEAAITQARAEGERAGIERAAEYHKSESARLRREDRENILAGGWPDHARLNKAEQHDRDAAAIRALAGKEA